MTGMQGQASGTKGDGRRERLILVGILMAVFVGMIATYWVGSPRLEGDAGGAEAGLAGVGENGRVAVAEAAMPARAVAPAPPAVPVFHADVYFDFESTRLRADAVQVLQETVALMDPESAWGVLVQGHADVHGPAEYNRHLAQRRADAVKRFLVELGVPEPSIRMVAIGQEGAVCEDPGPECQQLNRRVHLEIRKLPAAAAAAIRPVIADRDVFDIEPF
jgi:outer membrane protein OmpA-like peptidoglycan-associated protein